MTIVVDASAIVPYLTLGRAHSEIAALIESDDDLPWTLPLVDAEVGHALRGMEARSEIGAARAVRALERLGQMPMRRTGLISHLEHAWSLRANLSFYDALYVALAAKVGAPLVTLDTRLASAPNLPVPVIVPGRTG